MNRREAAWLAWYMCAVSLMLTVLGLLFLFVSRSPVGAPVYAGAPVFDFWLVNTVIAISFSTVGAVLAPRLPSHNPIGSLLRAIGPTGGIPPFVATDATGTPAGGPRDPVGRAPGGRPERG